MAENQAKATPARVLMLFAFLFAGVVASLWRYEQQRTIVQKVEYPTALGDDLLCPVRLLEPGNAFTATLDSDPKPEAFTVSSASAKSKREDRMWKVGIEEQGAFFLYQSDQAGETGLWVKSAEGLFYAVQAAPKA